MSSKQDSRALRFYSDVLGLAHLQYGLWQAGEETSLANLKTAQARAHLIDNMVAEPIFLFHHPAFSYTCLQSARFGRASLVLAGDRLKNRLSRRGQKFKNIKKGW
jgi:hypothetical protein